jgi:TRAP transporter 4TM/12TM fusion protein
LMPPVMGAAAFIMAQILGVSYANVMVAAVLPAILYYLAVFFAVDLEAARIGLKGLPRDQVPSITKLLRKRGILLSPLIVLIALLTGFQWSPMKAAFWATIVALAVGFIFPPSGDGRNPLRMIAALAHAIVEMAPITAAVACAGLIIGALTMTGVTLKLSTMLIDWSHGSMLVLLVLTMFASIVLGMGLPTVACYILLAILVAPALVTMGADPMAAHLFVFYFGIVSGITPPVAMAAFAAAAISGADQNQTGFTAVRIGLSAFILPYMFVLAPALLMKGSVWVIVLAACTASIGIWALTASVIGYGFGALATWERIGLFVAAVALIFPGLVSDLFGLTVFAVIVGRQFVARRQVLKSNSS